MEPLLEVQSLTKKFGNIEALSEVSLTVEEGQVHAVMGENGAGKSTLIKALSGIQPATSGNIKVKGVDTQINTLKDAAQLGIRTVFQELHIVPHLSVAENILLGSPPKKGIFIDKEKQDAIATELLADLGVSLNPRTMAGRLARAEQQIIEICRALLGSVDLLILDEPTASLGEPETRQLINIVKRLTTRGVGIIYVSHRMDEVLEISDKVTVLRDGKYISTHEAPVLAEQLVEDMIGRPPADLYSHEPTPPGETLLEVKNLTNKDIKHVSLNIRAGEIVGVTGLIGSGKSEIARAIFGLDPLEAGQVLVNGEICKKLTPNRMLQKGVVYYPSDRKREGLILLRTLKESITLGALKAGKFLTAGIIDLKKETKHTEELAERLSLKPSSTDVVASKYSGGNQQKALIARGMIHDAKIHLFDEPTVGIDVGAKADVYSQLDKYAKEGAAILLVSSDLTEVIGVSDRVYVVSEGRIQAELSGEHINESEIASHFFTSIN